MTRLATATLETSRSGAWAYISPGRLPRRKLGVDPGDSAAGAARVLSEASSGSSAKGSVTAAAECGDRGPQGVLRRELRQSEVGGRRRARATMEEGGPAERAASEDQAPEGGWGWCVALGMSVMFIVMMGPVGCFGLVFGEFLEAVGGGTQAFTVVVSVFVTSVSLTGLVTNYAMKEYSARQVGIAGCLLAFSGNFLSIFATSVNYLVITYGIVQGLTHMNGARGRKERPTRDVGPRRHRLRADDHAVVHRHEHVLHPAAQLRDGAGADPDRAGLHAVPAAHQPAVLALRLPRHPGRADGAGAALSARHGHLPARQVAHARRPARQHEARRGTGGAGRGGAPSRRPGGDGASPGPAVARPRRERRGEPGEAAQVGGGRARAQPQPRLCGQHARQPGRRAGPQGQRRPAPPCRRQDTRQGDGAREDGGLLRPEAAAGPGVRQHLGGALSGDGRGHVLLQLAARVLGAPGRAAGGRGHVPVGGRRLRPGQQGGPRAPGARGDRRQPHAGARRPRLHHRLQDRVYLLHGLRLPHSVHRHHQYLQTPAAHRATSSIRRVL
ncbi:uncharacterized protein LOC134531851 isoform X2 [Bacillus rossius redtenbacheri]|uniref:uncharacterized protein LOC134531851 isoform X2 n=1 Tax=Bacillus rossius redtenbacheri TaxID=93214 RepID=UPI002FDDD0C4